MTESKQNPFDIHTSVVEEALQKAFAVLTDLNLMQRPTGNRPNLPKSQFALVEAIAGCKALSATTRGIIREGLDLLPELEAALRTAAPTERRETDVCLAIIYASQSRADLDKGLVLIGECYPGKKSNDGVRAVRDIIKSGEGRIYGTASESVVDLRHAGSLPKSIYSTMSTLKADLGAVLGAVSIGVKDPRALGVVAVTASLAASFSDVLDWIFPEEVPLFPQGTGPYNPFPPGPPL